MATEYNVHFQRNTHIGARALRIVHVEANTANEAIRLANAQGVEVGYRLTRVDHFEGDHIVIDFREVAR